MTHMAPHDVSDLLLAPLALRLDGRLAELAGLTASELHYQVCLQTDREPRTPEQRREYLLDLLTRNVETHDWTLSWAERGLVLVHEDRQLVLGLPDNVRTFLA